ncbi:MAG: hypothetical protein RSB55_05120, partial [Oscillospiraceae bacterium]
MYRFAIIDSNRLRREELHRLAAAFFEQRGESVAFVMCGNSDELPAYYDCYLRGDETRVSFQRTQRENPPWECLDRPLERSCFFEVLERWRALPPSETREGGTGRVNRRGTIADR